jgi:uncharacterized membrane protein
MKNTIILFGLLLAACVPQSNLVSDRDGYTLQLDNYRSEVKAGQSLAIPVNILRSKAYLDKPVKLKLNATLPEGLTYHISPNPIILDNGTIQISTSLDAKKGDYTIVLAGDAVVPGIPAKGTVFKLSIN